MRKSGNHSRNTTGLKQSAQAKRAKTIQKCERALQKMQRERLPVNFTAVARAAKVSVAWLYKEDSIRQRIEHLRGNYQTKKAILPPSERISDDGIRSQHTALKLRNQQLSEEIRLLKQRISVAYGIISSNNLSIPE